MEGNVVADVGNKMSQLSNQEYDEIIKAPGAKVLSAQLPYQIILQHGCINCLWRGTPNCPFGFKRGRSHSLKKNIHANRICNPYRSFLGSIYTGDKKKPSYKEWLEDFNVYVANMQGLDDYNKFKELEREIAELEDEVEKEIAKMKEKGEIAG